MQQGNTGSFQLNDNWTAGILLPQPLTVMTTDATNFINLSGLSALQGQTGISLRVVGFVLINPATSQPVFIAGAVEELTRLNRSRQLATAAIRGGCFRPSRFRPRE